MNLLNIVLLAMIVIAGVSMFIYYTGGAYKKRKGAILKNRKEQKLKRAADAEDHKDFFWRNPQTFVWKSVALLFVFLMGLAINNLFGYIVSFISFISLVWFLFESRQNYLNLPKIVKERLDNFNNEVRTAIEKQVTFEADNIQKFADKDSEFDTKPKIFEFQVETKKMNFHPLNEDPKKNSIIIEQKLEFLVLSREYFSICQKAPKFDFFNHRGDVKKEFKHKKGGPGGCNEFYYSQMANVQYDGKAIRIIYEGDKEDAVFECKPKDKATNPAMKALKEKLRLTERQKFRKMQEHLSYEEIKDKRVKPEENKDSA